MNRLRSSAATVSYGDEPVVMDVDLDIPDGQITTIIGANGCGKSTLLRTLARLLRPSGGAVVLDGQLIHRMPARVIARRLGLLSQQAAAPDGITVEDLVRRGRFPHQGFLQPPDRRDLDAVDRALELAGMTDFRRRQVDSLSGGQRQRAWIAMALAQETPLLLLDEPTTYLDLAHQGEVLDLIARLNADEGRTIVLVLHDVNEAARISHRVVAMERGRVLREGPAAEVIEPDLLEQMYGVPFDVFDHPRGVHPIAVPRTTSGHLRHDRGAVNGAPGLETDRLRVDFGDCAILRDLSLSIPAGRITAIIGPNGCGKSTLLRCCACLVKPRGGCARIDAKDVRAGSRRAFARRLAMLAQGPAMPAGFRVEDLVALGRMPHQRLLRQWDRTDEDAIAAALARCGLSELRDREIETLSGGQRQRAWFAMLLAQATPVLLLDEPTTFLDPGAQIELLDLALELNRTEGRTIAMILHDLNLAIRYADWIVAMRDGAVVAAGVPEQIVTPSLLQRVFEVEADIFPDPVTGSPMVLPHRSLAPKRLATLVAS